VRATGGKPNFSRDRPSRRLAEVRNVGNANAANRERRVTIAARVPPALAEAMQRLAESGNRTVSREVFDAIRQHVDRSDVGGSAPLLRSTPAERGETSSGRQSSSSARAGSEDVA
jgi:predicted transcriptional regulator